MYLKVTCSDVPYRTSLLIERTEEGNVTLAVQVVLHLPEIMHFSQKIHFPFFSYIKTSNNYPEELTES